MILLVIILYHFAVSQCSSTLGKLDHTSIAKYCGRIGNCKPGEHVACKYYRPETTMGPKCNGAPIELNEKHRKHILSKINKMRADITYGHAECKDGTLPKGYGLQNLEWDDELAKLAQVWANQCNFSAGDVCRATERFPNPGQFMGGVRYSYPNFEEAGIRKVLRGSKALTEQKRNYIIESVLNKVYETRFLVTTDMINKHVGHGRRNLYLLVVNGGTTHVGCAMSYWISYHTDQQLKGQNLYSSALVCNLSSQPVEGQKVYETDPKWKRLRTHITTYADNPTLTRKALPGADMAVRSGNDSCNHQQPSVVVMPIIKVEDGPLHDERMRLANLKTTAVTTMRGVFNNQLNPINILQTRKLKDSVLKPSINLARRDSQTNNRRVIEIKDRFRTRKELEPVQNNPFDKNVKPNVKHPTKIPSYTKHESIFTRVSKFELPSQHRNNNQAVLPRSRGTSFRRRPNTPQKMSRQELSRLEELVSDYFLKRQGRPENSPANVMNPLINTLMQFLDTYPSTNSVDAINANNLRLRELKAINNLEYNPPNRNNRHSNEEVDEELLNFMYNLVQASGVDFNEIIDATTRIIQDEKLGKDRSQSSKGKLNEEDHANLIHANFDDRPVKMESEFTSLVTRKVNPLLPYGKEIYGNIRNSYHEVGGKNEYKAIKNNLGDIYGTNDILIVRNVDGLSRYLENRHVNDYYAVGDASKRTNYFHENIDTFETKPKNRRNYRRHSYLNVNVPRPNLGILHYR